MIDLDRMDEQLESALTDDPAPIPVVRPPARPAAPVARPAAPQPRVARAAAPVARPAAPQPRVARAAAPALPPATALCDVRQLLELGRLDEVDARIAGATNPVDRASWATMRALLAGRRDAVVSGVAELLAQAQAAPGPDAWDRYWLPRFWAALEWGTAEERMDVLDHCRERAYRFDDLTWWGNIALLLATLGNVDEATRAFDIATPMAARLPRDGVWLDVTTNLVEAASIVGDSARMGLVHRTLAWPEGRLVVVGPGLVCKGSVDRYQALGLAALGRWGEAAERFRAAAAAHRAIGADPLLARTLAAAERAQVAA